MIIINGVGVMHTQQDCVMGISEGLALTHILLILHMHCYYIPTLTSLRPVSVFW